MGNIFVVDLSLDKTNLPYISSTLINSINNSFKNGKKVILYINKRGAYDLLVCSDCNSFRKCPRCDIALGVHKNPEILMCHHCSYTEEILLSCKNCFGTNLKKVGIGTEQIEESIKKIFPQTKTFRLDTDNVKTSSLKKKALESIKESQIIIGTKMIFTGFDFENIGTIGLILIEQELQIPKYDVEEKVFQNIRRLIGVSSRNGENLDVVVQTFIPNNEFVKDLFNSNYKDFFKKTLKERKTFNYPPFVELVSIRCKDKNKEKLISYMNSLKLRLDKLNNGRYEIIKVENVLKRNNQYFLSIIVKGRNVRDFLQNVKKEILKNKNLTLIFD